MSDARGMIARASDIVGSFMRDWSGKPIDPNRPVSRSDLLEGSQRLARISATEQEGVHHEGQELVGGDAVAPSVSEGQGFVVGTNLPRTESAEEVHHGDVELAMPPLRRRIDEPASPIAVDETVPGPQVAVDQRGRLVRTEVFGFETIHQVQRRRRQ